MWPRTPEPLLAYADYVPTARAAVAQVVQAHTPSHPPGTPTDRDDAALDWAEVYSARDGMFYMHRPSGAVTLDMPAVLAPPSVSEWLQDAVHAHFALDDPTGRGQLPIQSVYEKLQSSDLGLFLPPDIAEAVVMQFAQQGTPNSGPGGSTPYFVNIQALARALKGLLVQLYASHAAQPSDWCYMHAGPGRGFFWTNKRTGVASRTTPVDVLVALHTPPTVGAAGAGAGAGSAGAAGAGAVSPSTHTDSTPAPAPGASTPSHDVSSSTNADVGAAVEAAKQESAATVAALENSVADLRRQVAELTADASARDTAHVTALNASNARLAGNCMLL